MWTCYMVAGAQEVGLDRDEGPYLSKKEPGSQQEEVAFLGTQAL